MSGDNTAIGTYIQCRRILQGIAMIIRTHAYMCGNDVDIVLIVIGVGILAHTPLADILVIASTHDRTPGNQATAMSAVVSGATSHAIM